MPVSDDQLIDAFNTITTHYKKWYNELVVDLGTVPDNDRKALEEFYDRQFRCMNDNKRMAEMAQKWLDFIVVTGFKKASVK